MTGEPADHHVDVGDVYLSLLVGIKHLVDVLVDAASLAETCLVAAPGELLGVVPGRFPLVGPDRLERPCGWHVEFWVRLVVITIKGEAKASDAGEELGDANHIG